MRQRLNGASREDRQGREEPFDALRLLRPGGIRQATASRTAPRAYECNKDYIGNCPLLPCPKRTVLGYFGRFWTGCSGLTTVLGTTILLGIIGRFRSSTFFEKGEIMHGNRTQRQIEAARRNGKLGGVKTDEGKAISRMNARKHGVFDATLTEFDGEELRGVHAELVASVKPDGVVEGMLVEKLAHTYVRLQRCARAQGENHIRTWEQRRDEASLKRQALKLRDGIRVSNFRFSEFERAVEIFARYDTMLTNQFIKILHELERMQRIRCGDKITAPAVADVTICSG